MLLLVLIACVSGPPGSTRAPPTPGDAVGSAPPDPAPVLRGPGGAPRVLIESPTPLGVWEATSGTLEISGTVVAASGAERPFTERVDLVEGLQDVVVEPADGTGAVGRASLQVLWQQGRFLGEVVDLDGHVFAPGDTISPVLALPGDATLVLDCGDGLQRLPMAPFPAPALGAACQVWAEIDGARTLPVPLATRPALVDGRLSALAALAAEVRAQAAAEGPEAAAAALAARTDLSAVGWTADAVWWETEEGVLFQSSAGQFRMSDDGEAAASSGPAAPRPTAPAHTGPPPPPSLSEGEVAPDYHLYLPFYGEGLGTYVDREVDRIVEGGTCADTGKQVWTGDTVTVSQLGAMDDGIHVLATHAGWAANGYCVDEEDRRGRAVPAWFRCGADQAFVAVLTGETVSAFEGTRRHYDDLVNQRISFHNFWDDSADRTHAAVHPAFFAHHLAADQLAHAVVLFASCSVGRDHLWHAALREGDVLATYGFDDLVGKRYAQQNTVLTLYGWAQQGLTLHEAAELALEHHHGLDDDAWARSLGLDPGSDSPALPVVRGDADIRAPSLTLEDGDFEAEGGAWRTEHTAAVVSFVEHVYPVDGSRMLDLGVQPGTGTAYSWATQEIAGGTLEPGSYTLSFQRRILTSDDNHWQSGCDGMVNPWFVARIDAPSGNRLLFEEDPSAFCDELTEHQSGWWWESDWRTIEVPFTVPEALPGARVTFQVGSANPYEHHTLVDTVTLSGECAR